MNQCPKCGCREISGPKYEAAGWQSFVITIGRLSEWLRYTCRRCGYSATTPTRDVVKEKP